MSLKQRVWTAGSVLFAIVLLTLVNSFVNAQTNCPHQAQGLTLFSSLSGFSVANGQISVSTAVKVDKSPPNKLRSITVLSGGSLIFDNANLTLNVDFIRVESGAAWIMGSATCPITNKIVLTLYGARTSDADIGSDPFDGVSMGSKGIGFLSGSRVQIFGQIDTPTFTDLAVTVKKGSNQIQLTESVSWRVGDSIVIASSDYGELYDSTKVTSSLVNWKRGVAFPDQNEERIITQVLNGGKTIVLDAPLNYTHYSNGAEIRPEVGLLSRRIVFQGDNSSDASNFGGHLMVRLVTQFQVEGLEIRKFGQYGLMGRYSFHLHLLENIAQNTTFGTQYYIKGCSVHDSFQRCYVVHDTNYFLLEDNVCFNANGHQYFLEDGSELGNVFRHNLGIRPKPVYDLSYRLIPSDSDVSVFWITNPNNTYINNHGVGGRHTFWFTMPTFPTGVSATIYAPGSINPRTAPPKPFSGNVAHSGTNGLFVDDMEKPDGTTELAGYYPSVEGLVDNFTAYKMRGYGIWARCGNIVFKNMYLTDNLRQMNSPPGTSLVIDSIMIAESDNVGDYTLRPSVDVGNRTRPNAYYSLGAVIKGYETYDNGGAQLLRNITFRNFVTDKYRKAGALSVLDNFFKLHTRNRYSKLIFENSPQRVYLDTVTYDNHKGDALMDIDGSVTGVSGGAWIVGIDPLLNFDGCITRYDWNNASVCPLVGESYFQLTMMNFNLSGSEIVDPYGVSHREFIDNSKKFPRTMLTDLTRNVQSNMSGTLSSGGQFYMQNNVPARGFYYLKFAWDLPPPNPLGLSMQSSAAGDWVVLAIQYPLGTTFTVTALSLCKSLDDVVNFPTQCYYFNTTTGHFYVKLKNSNSKSGKKEWYGHVDYGNYGNSMTLNVTAKCPNNYCGTIQSPPPNPRELYRVYMKEDRFVGNLEMCQQNAVSPLAYGSTSATGNVFAFLNYNDRLLDIVLHHSLNNIATMVEVGVGAPGTVERMITYNYVPSPYSQSRFGLQLSHSEWVDLLKGRIFVKVSSSENPTGHLRAQLYCNGKCNLPPAVSTASPCEVANASEVITLYDEGATFKNTGFTNGPYASGAGDYIVANMTYPFNPVCGNSSYYFGLRKGALQIYRTSTSTYVDTSIYKYFEFYIKGTNNSGSIDLNLSFASYNKTSNVWTTIKSLTTNATYIQHYKIDDTRLTRVRYPLSHLGFQGVQQFNRFAFSLSNNGQYREMILDNIRFIGEQSTNETTSRYITSSEIKTWGSVSTCGKSTSPDFDPLTVSSLFFDVTSETKPVVDTVVNTPVASLSYLPGASASGSVAVPRASEASPIVLATNMLMMIILVVSMIVF